MMQGPCAAWVEKGCAAVLLQHFLLGFELDLYQPKEFCMLYWYAPDIPQDSCRQVLKRKEKFTLFSDHIGSLMRQQPRASSSIAVPDPVLASVNQVAHAHPAFGL